MKKRKRERIIVPLPPGADGMGDCGLYRCARCGGTFAVMPSIHTSYGWRISAPLDENGEPAPVRPYALIGGRKWCSECAERRYPRHEQTYMELEEWRSAPRRGSHGKTSIGGCTAGAESAPRESEETDGQERLPPRRGRDGARLQARAESAGAAAPERRATASAGAPSCGSLRAGGARPVGNRTAEGARQRPAFGTPVGGGCSELAP